MHGAVDGTLFHELDSLRCLVAGHLSLVLQVISNVVYLLKVLRIVLSHALVFGDAHLAFGRHESAHHSKSVLNFLLCQLLFSF